MQRNTKIALGIAGALTAVAVVYLATKKSAPAAQPQPSPQPMPQPQGPSAAPPVIPWDPSQPWSPVLPGLTPAQVHPDLQLPTPDPLPPHEEPGLLDPGGALDPSTWLDGYGTYPTH